MKETKKGENLKALLRTLPELPDMENEPGPAMTVDLSLLSPADPSLPDEELKPLQHLFADGTWMPSADPLVIGPQNFSDMQNLAFGERELEGVPGYTKINTTPLVAYSKIRSGIQLTAPFTTKSRVLVQAYDAALSASQVLQNKTAIPTQGDFEATALHTDAAGAGLGRFAKWPGNQIAYCNGVESKIYGGDEIPCAAFLTSTAAVTGAMLTNPLDYSEQMRNSIQTADQVAVIGGGNDSYTQVLLDFESKDGAKIADTSVGGSGANDADLVGTADWSTDWAKFKTKSGKISAADGAFSIPTAAGLNFGAADGTIDCWRKGNSLGTPITGYYSYDSGTGRITCNSGTDFTTFAAGDPVYASGAEKRVGQVVSVAGDKSYMVVEGDFVNADTYAAISYGSAICGRYQDATHYWYVALFTTYAAAVVANGAAPAFYSFPMIPSGGGIGGSIEAILWHTLSFTPGLQQGLHMALVQDYGTSLDLYLLGRKFTFGNVALPDLTAPLTFGRCQWSAANSADAYQGADVYYDMIRLSKGVARWPLAFNPPTRAYSLAARTFLAGFSRPVQAVNLYIAAAGSNGISGTSTTGKEHNGNSWASLAVTDGTAAGGASIAQTGSIAFASTVGSSMPKLIEGLVLYWYQFTLSAGEAEIYQVTGDAPWQDIRDVWDGTEILLQSCLVYVTATTSYKDFTGEAADEASSTIVEIDALATTEHVLFGSPVPLMGFNVRMSSDAAKVNGNAAVMALAYCDGGAIAEWPAVSCPTDGTAADGKSMKQSGMISFTPVKAGQEFKVSINGGEPMYQYKVSFIGALSASVEAYYITGIPAPQPIGPYIFPFTFLGRPMLCGRLASNEGHRVDWGMKDASDVWNGPDSSNGVDNEPLYFGVGGKLVAAAEVYNRLGASVYSFGIFCKAYETYILNGYDAQTYRPYPVSAKKGCVAPLTMDTWELGVNEDGQAVRSIAMWLSHAGPLRFESGGLTAVPGLECYFKKRDPRCVNFAAIANARGWFDPDTGHYNLEFPSGAGQTVNNVWVALNPDEKKWYPIVPSAATSPYLGAAFLVEDQSDPVRKYVYGARDNGYMMRIHDPSTATWDGTASVQSVTLGDILCSGNIWDKIRIAFLKLFGVSTTEAISAAATHYADGATAGTTLTAIAQNGANRYYKDTQPLNILAWSHRIKFSATVTTEARGLRLLGWGLKYLIERDDHQ